MPINILCLGKTKDAYLDKGIQEYQKRLSAFDKVNLHILPDVKLTKTSSVDIVKEKESEIILKKIKTNDFVIALDERGSQMSSLDFSSFMEKKRALGTIVFVIGGVYGLHQKVIDRANYKLSFSQFTFTHRMIRLLLMEQIYRAFAILKGKSYHY